MPSFVNPGARNAAGAGVDNKWSEKLALGKKISSTAMDKDAVSGILEILGKESFGDQKVVFSQSLADGTLAMKGTEVDLVLVPRKEILFGVFKGSHIALVEKNLVELKTIMDNDDVQAMLLKYESGEALTTTEKNQLDEILAAAELNIVFDDTKQDQSHTTFIQTLAHAKPLYADG